MGLEPRVTALPLPSLRAVSRRVLTGRVRRSWRGNGRAHIEHRPVPAEAQERFADEVTATLMARDGVRAVTVNAWVRRVVVSHDEGRVRCEELVRCIEAAEAAVGVGHVPFPADAADHPGDVEPLLREAVQVLSDVAGLGGAVYGRLREMAPGRGPADLSSLMTLLENVPQLRQSIERTAGERTTDLVLGVSSSLVRGVTLGVTGQIVDMTRRVGRIRALAATRGAWERREPELLDPPAPAPTTTSRPGRVVPLPDGPVERYVAKGWSVALGGFAASVIATEDVDRSMAPLLDGIPKAARLGRDAFCSQLSRVLASRGCLVLQPVALQVLDRVDTVVLEADLALAGADDGSPRSLSADGARFLQALRATPLDIVLTASTPHVAPDVGECVEAGSVDRIVADRQEDGAVVLAIGATGAPAFARADVRVGMQPTGHPPAWDADVLCGEELADALLMVRAAAVAARNSAQAVALNTAGAGIGATTALGGFRRRTTRRVLQVADAATLLAMGNGFRLAGDLASLPSTLRRVETPWHALEVDAVLERLGSSPDGLSREQLEQRREPPSRPPSRVLQAGRSAGQELANPITPVLGGGIGLSLATGAVTDASMVASVLGLNAFIGGTQRYRAERAIETLQHHQRRQVTVVRDGCDEQVATDDLVVGDLVRLVPGDPVPADARVVDSHGLEVDESSLTGESLPVAKSPEPVRARALADRRSMVYQASTVAAGEGLVAVVATGEDTQARLAMTWTDLDGHSLDTGVEARLQQLTRTTIPLALLSAGGVTLSGLVRRTPTRELVDAGIGLAIAAVPEGLPLLASAAQRAAARRLSHHGILARDPRAIEALGRVDVLCADKTGTLTEGRIRLDVVSDGRTDVPAGACEGPHAHVLLTARRATPIDPDAQRLPHPTDEAVAAGTRALGVHRQANGGFDVLDDLPFEPGRSFHAVLAGTADGRRVATKGAPEEILRRSTRWDDGQTTCALDAATRDRLLEEAERLASRGLRVLAVAERPFDGDEVTDDDVDDLAFVGFLGLRDPVRPVARESIRRLHRAGITVIMITGDHPTTARSIAAELHLQDGQLLTGPDIDELDDAQLAEVLPDVSVFARVTPLHKARLVRALQGLGRVVAMTGDGANDAPAIRLADVGIAVGTRATSAARDTADLVITDDRLEVLVDAIAEGRGMWGSVRDAVSVLVGGNLGEISFTLLGSLIGRRPPLTTRQLLLINLLTDVAPAMTLAVRSPRTSVDTLLAEGPERSLGAELDRHLLWRGIGATAGATTTFAVTRWTGSLPRARTAGLVALVGSQLGQTIATSRGDMRVVATGVGSFMGMAAMIQTPGVSRLVGCRPVGPIAWWNGTAGAIFGTAVGILGPRVERRLTGDGDSAWTSALVDRLSELAPDLPGVIEARTG